jgi:hypothetical protein
VITALDAAEAADPDSGTALPVAAGSVSDGGVCGAAAAGSFFVRRDCALTIEFCANDVCRSANASTHVPVRKALMLRASVIISSTPAN